MRVDLFDFAFAAGHRPLYRRARQASAAPRGALVAGILASNRSCHVEAIQTRRHSVHKCKPSCGAGAESLACSILGNGRGPIRGAARGIQYSVATSLYQLDRRSIVTLYRGVSETRTHPHQLRGAGFSKWSRSAASLVRVSSPCRQCRPATTCVQ